VLVADDRPDIRSLARMFLESAGARVETADDGLAAIEAIRLAEAAGSPFDVVVMDMQMPGLDGYDTVARLRRLGFSRPVVALTASAMRGDRERCLRAGCTDYLPKPIDRRHFVELVGRHSRPPAPPEADAEAPRPASQPPPRPTPAPQAGRRVLLVDDSPDIRLVTARLLRWAGHRVQTAGDGRTAVELAAEFRPEVVLLDLGLPDIHGLDLIGRLKQVIGPDSARFVAVTGRDAPEDRDRVRQAGFDHHLVKPIDFDALAALIPEPRSANPGEPT
jgi:CheY-like chemotaxis protein